MKKVPSSFCLLLIILWMPAMVQAAQPVRIDVLYMNHGPLIPTIQQIKSIFGKYEKKIAVSWHDVGTDDGQNFMAKKGIRQHIPLFIWMDDQSKFQLGGKDILFAGFPTGSGPGFFQGKWTMADLEGVLDQVTGKK